MGLTLRQDKGLPLDNSEVDGNFVYLEGLSEQNSTALGTHKSSGDHDARYPLKTTTVTGTGALTGGGGLEENQQIDASPETKESLAKADSALQPDGNLEGLTDKAAARTNLGLGTSATVDASVTPAAGKIPLGGSAGTIQTVWVQDLSYKLDQYLAQLTALRSPSATPSLYQEWGHGASMLHPALTFSRATTSTYIEDGVLKTAAANVPVFEDGGLRIEPQATNEARPSAPRKAADLNGLGTTGVLLSYDAGVSPDGTNTALRVQYDGSGDARDFLLRVTGQSVVATKQGSVFCWANADQNVRIGGNLVSSASGNVLVTSVKNRAFFPVMDSASTSNPILYPLASNIPLDIYTWGWQVEIGNRVTSYIPTLTGPVSRATDSASITGANFANIYNPASGSLILSGDSYYMRSDIANNVLRLSDQIAIRRDVDEYLYLVRAGQSDLQILSSNQATNNIGLAWGSNGLDIFVNGAKKHADLAIPGGTIDSLILADSDTAVQNIKRLGIYKQRLTDMLLTGLTA